MTVPTILRVISQREAWERTTARRAWAAAVVCVAQGDGGDLEPLIALGEELGDRLGRAALEALGGGATAYGKSAIVGVGLPVETGAAVLHPRLGKPLRALLGGGKALIPSTVKRGGPGAVIDVPLHGKDDEWDFALLDAVEARVGGAPGPREIVVVVALASGGRPDARIGVA
jgi:hypothetical protein